LIGLQNTEEDILIFALGKDLVQQVAGEFIFQVSAFSEINTIEVNGEKQPSAPGIFEASIRVPYQLQPGENIFLVKSAVNSSYILNISQRTKHNLLFLQL